MYNGVPHLLAHKQRPTGVAFGTVCTLFAWLSCLLCSFHTQPVWMVPVTASPGQPGAEQHVMAAVWEPASNRVNNGAPNALKGKADWQDSSMSTDT